MFIEQCCHLGVSCVNYFGKRDSTVPTPSYFSISLTCGILCPVSNY